MRFKNQAILLNMHKHDGLYEKAVDGYRVQFVSKCNLQKIRKLPCLIFMVGRGMSIVERDIIKQIVNNKRVHIHFESFDVNNDTVCMHVKVNNKTIDLVMHYMYRLIKTFATLHIDPLDEKTYSKYKFSFGDSHQVEGILADI